MKPQKHVFILRHAKSSWKYPHLSDFDRPLNGRGKRDLPFMADYLRREYADIAPQWILSSGANRALTTAKGFAAVLQLPIANADKPRDLYHAGRSELTQQVMDVPEYIDRVMLVGHNPGLTDFANFLMRPEDEKIFNVPTCAFVVLAFEMEQWSQLRRGSGHLISMEFPKKFQ